jgi:hypothetical protein
MGTSVVLGLSGDIFPAPFPARNAKIEQISEVSIKMILHKLPENNTI